MEQSFFNAFSPVIFKYVCNAILAYNLFYQMRLCFEAPEDLSAEDQITGLSKITPRPSVHDNFEVRAFADKVISCRCYSKQCR